MIEVQDSGSVLLGHGPMEMSIYLEKDGDARSDLGTLLGEALIVEFDKLLPYMDRFRLQRDFQLSDTSLPESILRMVRGIELCEDEDLNTLAAVAGAIADQGMKIAREEYGIDRGIINNGGDIALYDMHRGFEVSIPATKYGPYQNLILSLKPEDGVQGVCCSGNSGRSFTRGIADFTVVLAKDASVADAGATHIANMSFVEDPAILSCMAEEIDTGTDIPGRRVVVKVWDISEKTRYRAIVQMLERTEYLCTKGILKGAVFGIKGTVSAWPEDLRLRFA